jgi:hypothetical protein
VISQLSSHIRIHTGSITCELHRDHFCADQIHARQELELEYVRNVTEWEAKEKAGDEDLPPAPEGPVSQTVDLRNKRRAVFVSRVQGKLRLCPVKDNIDLGGAKSHWMPGLVVVEDASK